MAESIVADTSATTKSTASIAVEQTSIVLGEIALLANVIEDLGARLVDDGAEAFSEHNTIAVREFASKIGWLADLCQPKIGGGSRVFRGRAEDWMLPPACHELERHDAEARTGAARV